MTYLCEFCNDRARGVYREVYLCRWHMLLLYFGLSTDWHD